MIKKVSILSSAGDVSNARLHRFTNQLNTSGIQVHVYAPGKASDAPKNTTFHKTLNSKSKYARLFRDLTLPFRAKGDAIFTLSPDLVPLSFFVARLTGKKIIADINEDYLKLLRDRAWAKGLIGFGAKAIAWSANKISKNVDLLVVADAQVPPFDAKNRIVIKNYPDSSMIPDSGKIDTEPRAIYIGDIRKTRGLYSMLKIAELAPKWHFDFVGPIAKEDESYVESWQKNNPASSRVTFHGMLEPYKSWNFAKGAWVGLTMLEQTPAFIEAVPGKLYEYAYAGLAIISSPLPRCVELINESGGGMIAQSDEGAANILNSWAQNPEALQNFRNKSRHWGREVLNPDAHYAQLRSAIEKLQ